MQSMWGNLYNECTQVFFLYIIIQVLALLCRQRPFTVAVVFVFSVVRSMKYLAKNEQVIEFIRICTSAQSKTRRQLSLCINGSYALDMEGLKASKPTKQGRNNASHHPYILCHFSNHVL